MRLLVYSLYLLSCLHSTLPKPSFTLSFLLLNKTEHVLKQSNKMMKIVMIKTAYSVSDS